jgi:hypothetical protein
MLRENDKGNIAIIFFNEMREQGRRESTATSSAQVNQ